MQEYIRFMNRKNRKNVIKLLFLSFLAIITFGFLAYSNTRYNGFADVPPVGFYASRLKQVWEFICDMLFRFEGRFINFFQ